MKRALAVFLCLWIAFPPAICHAGAGTKIPGFDKSFAPALPKPKLPNEAAKVQPDLKLTVSPKKQPAALSKASGSEATKAASLNASGGVTSNTLPVAVKDKSGNIILGQGISSISVDSAKDEMIITQNKAQAIQDWTSFNIGAKAEVDFSQKSSSWVVLNRIFDLNPTQIFGKINAKGGVYLINQNGILFGRGSQVDVHALTASSLNISNFDFLTGVLTFNVGPYWNTGNTDYLTAWVINRGAITTDNEGSVFLLAPKVTNDATGTIQTRAGQIGLAAGAGVSLAHDTNPNTTRLALLVSVSTPGQATNNGKITAETGLVGMYGRDINQNGVISALTELRRNGQIELLASDSVTTGPDSTTITPISGSTEAADSRFQFQPGTITIEGSYAGAPVKTIVNEGALVANSGTITLDADQRVFLASGSSIDVSGEWINEPASAILIKVQMNSYNLRDEPIQKNGILKGKWITVDLLDGSSIGDISQAILAQDKTARQFSLTGGSIIINSESGDIIAKEGSTLNFAGGGTTYASGSVTTTGLISGNKIYDISNAPETLEYNGITTVTNHVDSFVQGANAGQLILNARHLVLDGHLNGAVTQGPYQTQANELYNAMVNQKTDGLQEPVGGTLILGNENGLLAIYAQSADFGLDGITLRDSVSPLPSTFGPGDQPYAGPQQTILSTDILNAAKLSTLSIYTNTNMTIDAGARIVLNPGGSFTAIARQIVDNGAISVPGGKISLTLKDNMTSFSADPSYVSLDSYIHLDNGSSLDASGQQINNFNQNTSNDFIHIGGGTISVMDETDAGQGIVMQRGARIDVSGGYSIGPTGTVTGGNAGALSMQGFGIVLDGDLSGMSLIGKNGGSISLTAQNVWVASSPQSMPQDYNAEAPNYLILGSSELGGTGFTQIALRAADKLTFDSGTFSPSFVKFYLPAGGISSGEERLITVSPDLIGSSSITASAGVPFTGLAYPPPPVLDAPIKVSSGAAIVVAPGGTIGLSAPQIEISGALTAPAGTISANATQENLTLNGARISAAGYNEENSTAIMSGLPHGYTPMAGGSVTLEATNLTTESSTSGNVIMDGKSVVDVSGSTPVTSYLLNSGVPAPLTVAAAPGSLTISFTGTNSSLAGSFKGQSYLSGLQGGTLSIISMNTGIGYTLTGADIRKYLGAGFDSLAFQSWASLVFSGTMDFQIGRSLTLDAPVITCSGPGQDEIAFSAPWIQLQNTSPSSPRGTAVAGNSRLDLSGDWIDIHGSIQLDGFEKTTLSAKQDMHLFDVTYGTLSSGELMTPGDLTLEARRIYPDTQANFTFDSGGNVTIQNSGAQGSDLVYSAGGSLTIDANNIDIEKGYLAAPMGQIDLNAKGRVYIADGSVITTAATEPIAYGTLSDVSWTVVDVLTNATVLVKSPPVSSVNITGTEVVETKGSKIDVSGGGGIFGYEFQPSLQGSVDPLKGPANNSFVIVPNGSCSIPGQAVHLEGGKGLAAGVYSILPEQYAFLPGAMIVTPLGGAISAGQHLVTSDGYSVMAGYSTFMDTSVRSSLMTKYEVRPAADVFEQGYFNTSSFSAGSAGNISITGNTTILSGKILAVALNGYMGGTISLSGANAFIEGSGSQIPSDPASGTLYVDASALTGFYQIDIGNLNSSAGAITDTVTMEKGSILQATQVVLSAQNAITLDSGAKIVTIDSSGNGNGWASLVTPTGLLTMQQNSLVHASDQVNMTIGRLNYQAGAQGVQIGHGALNLTGQDVYFIPQQGNSPSNADPLGLYLTSAFWGNFGNFNAVNISASGGYSDGSAQGLVGFLGGMNLHAKDSFTINAAAIKGLHATDSGHVTINAPSISLLNSGGGSPSSPALSDVGSLTLDANWIYLGEGTFLNGLTPASPKSNGLLIDGFSALNLNAKDDITFQGQCQLNTSADISFKSARVTTSYYQAPPPATQTNTQYPTTPPTPTTRPITVADFTVSTTGEVDIASNGVTPERTAIPGGTLKIDANKIDVSGVIQMASGTLDLSGTTGITLESNARVLDGGSARAIVVNGFIKETGAPGGSVVLNSESGSVDLKAGSVVDVSGVSEDNSYYAAGYKINYNVFTDPNDIGINAGLISIYSSGPVSITGTLKGDAGTWTSYRKTSSVKGTGGSFILNARDLSDNAVSDKGFSALNTKLFDGGFTESIDVTLTGANDPNRVLTIGNTIIARNFNLTADNWSIDFSGTIDSTKLGGGGTIQLNSGGDLTLAAGSKILSPGATVFLNTADGSQNQPGNLNFYGSIDVAGQSGQAGGIVHFRSLHKGSDDVYMNFTGGRITGAAQIIAEAVSVVSPSDGQNIYAQDIGGWQSSLSNYMSAALPDGGARLQKELRVVDSAALQLAPGLEVRSSGDLTLQDAWDLTTYSGAPGFLTLRAAGNLNIDNNLTDAPSGLLTTQSAAASWGLNLIAGSNLNSSNPMITVKGLGSNSGNLNIADGVMVYTENGPIRFASGNDTLIGSGAQTGYMINSQIRYNLGSFSGSVQGEVGGDLVIQAGAIQTATGDIDIAVGGNLSLEYGTIFGMSGYSTLGAIRTLGQTPTETINHRKYSAYWDSYGGGSINLMVAGAVEGNLQSNSWDYTYSSRQLGKNWGALYVDSEGSGLYTTAGIVTMGGGSLSVVSGGDFTCQIGAFGVGSGNLNIYSGGNLDGRFLIRNGAAELTAMGNFGSTNSVIEAFNAKINVTAEGNVALATVANPKTAEGLNVIGYTENSAVSLTSMTGDVTLSGTDPYALSGTLLGTILPPDFEVYARGNIFFESDFVLAPAPKGNLRLVAAGDIDGQYATYVGGSPTTLNANIYVSDLDPSQVYGVKLDPTQLYSQTAHSSSILHANDPNPIVISAGGDIENIQLYLPKKAQITAAGDIDNIFLLGQNLAVDDVTTVKAGGSILFNTASGNGAVFDSGIKIAGPGLLLVQAGGMIDLGTSDGIQSIGDIFNPALQNVSASGCSLLVVSGYSKDFSLDKTSAFFGKLAVLGDQYANELAENETSQAQETVAKAETGLIAPFLGSTKTNEAGTINMIFSQISTTAAGGIYVLSSGTINVGKSSFATAGNQNTGIYTSAGGDINIYAEGDVNVNQSRVMTFDGGNIIVWSNHGSINAGKGSPTAANLSPPQQINVNGVIVEEFVPPVVGSGIRATAYDPNAQLGDVALFAPQGDIDASEAGIAGNIVTLGALQVLNVQNITAVAGSVGLPVTSSGSTALGTMSGVGAVAQEIQAAQAAAASAAGAKAALKGEGSDTFSASLEVRVLSFFNVDQDDSGWEKTEN